MPEECPRAVRAILSLRDEELDYARTKLALDRIIVPSLDVKATLAELDRLTEAATGLVGQAAFPAAKLGAVRRVIYDSGPWNEYRPFAYDHSDPLGRRIPNKLIHNYIARRLGQCVSMPVLFLILGERLGLNMALVSAPEHVFVRYIDPNGRILNIEATSGGRPARDEWYRQTFPMTDRALQSGLYMRSLSRREAAALMATTVLEHLWHENRFEEVIAVARIILEHDPRAGQVLVAQGSAFGALLRSEFEERYPFPHLIPEPLRLRRLMLIERNNSLMTAAVALGWSPVELESD